MVLTTKRLLSLIIFEILGLFLVVVGSHSQTSTQHEAFPGVQGFGRVTAGGRGISGTGTVFSVNTLADVVNGSDGLISLREALECRGEVPPGPRWIVFNEISGIVDLAVDDFITIDDPWITVNGQTSPRGILIKSWGIKVLTHNVVIRGLRIRPGDGDAHHLPVSENGILAGTSYRVFGSGGSVLYNNKTYFEFEDFLGVAEEASFKPFGGATVVDVDHELSRNLDLDCINILSENSNPVFRVVIDHCSMAWSIDKIVGVHRSRGDDVLKEITISNNIFSNALASWYHPKGNDHNLAVLLSGPQRISLYRNLFNANLRDQPKVSRGARAELVNNIVNDYGMVAIDVGGPSGDAAVVVDVVSNWVQTRVSPPEIKGINVSKGPEIPPFTRIFAFGNRGYGRYAWNLGNEEDMMTFDPSKTWEDYRAKEKLLSGNTISASAIMDADRSLLDNIVARVGAWNGGKRDDFDERVIRQEVADSSGVFPTTAGAYPEISNTARYNDEDRDGIPDSWEAIYGSNIHAADAWNNDADPLYKNIEMYCNSFLFFDDTSEPTGVSVDTPAESTVVSGDNVLVTGSGSDSVGIRHAIFMVGTTLIGTDLDYPYSAEWNTEKFPDGWHRIEVVIEDLMGNRSNDSHAVYVNHTARKSESFFTDSRVIPHSTDLIGSFPNPFNSTTTIRYALSESGPITIGIYNSLGQLVDVLKSGRTEAGFHSVLWDAGNRPTGIYFCQLKANDFAETQKLLLVR